MSKDNNIINVGYFNVDEDNKNSILENAPFQDNEINQHLDNIESLTKEIKEEVLKSEVGDKDKAIDFEELKKK